MGFTFDMFKTDEEIFRKDLFNYSVKRCGCIVVYVRDFSMEGLRLQRPYIIMPSSYFEFISDFARPEDEGVYSIAFEEWEDFSSREVPYISYCSTEDAKYPEVLILYLSHAARLVTEADETECSEELELVMSKYKKRYFSKAGRHKYKVYRLIKNK